MWRFEYIFACSGMINKTTNTVSGIQVKNLALTQYVFFYKEECSRDSHGTHTHTHTQTQFKFKDYLLFMMNNSFDNDIRLHGMNT